MSTRLRKFGARSLKSLAASLWGTIRAGTRMAQGRNHAAEKVTILCYHRIVTDIVRAERRTMHGMVISAETFRRQMELVREHYDVLSLADAVAVLRGERNGSRPALAITFDDGYRDFYELAWPILRELGLPSTVFIPTAYIGAGRMLDHDRFYRYVMEAYSRRLSLRVPLTKAGFTEEKVAALSAGRSPRRISEQLGHLPFALRERTLRCLDDFIGGEQNGEIDEFSLLDWDQAREMAGSGVSFGAHTVNHVILTNEEPQTVEREVVRGKQVIEEKLGQTVRHFAYPTGRYNAAVREVVAGAGFEAAFTTERRLNRPGDDLLTLGRICLCEESTRGVTGRYSEAVARWRLAL
jgi:peptidoglycan/xylan/chitin deacetylase (PgdA/CDA1 family)